MTCKRDRIFKIELIPSNLGEKEGLYLEDVDFILKRIKLLPEDIDGVQPRGGGTTKRCDVRVKDLGTWQDRNLEKYFGNTYTIPHNQKSFVMTRAYEDITTLIVKGVPMYWENDRLLKIFAWYGEVKKIEEEVWRSNPRIARSVEYSGIHNGNFKIQIILKKSIPSSLSIDREKIEVHYRGQELSCWKCGRAHYKDECGTAWGNYINRFSFKEFEKAFEEEMEEDEESEEEDVTNAPQSGPTATATTIETPDQTNMEPAETVQEENIPGALSQNVKVPEQTTETEITEPEITEPEITEPEIKETETTEPETAPNAKLAAPELVSQEVGLPEKTLQETNVPEKALQTPQETNVPEKALTPPPVVESISFELLAREVEDAFEGEHMDTSEVIEGL